MYIISHSPFCLPYDDRPPAAMRVYHGEVRFSCSAFVEMTSGKQRFCHLRREISPLCGDSA